MNALYLAYAYLRYHWGRSTVMVLVAALILFVPFATQILLTASERSLTSRADQTPLVLGAKGSALDLIMASLYFSEEHPEMISMQDVEDVWASDLATPVPVHTAFSASGFRIVGTTLDYFDFRQLKIADGRPLAILGEAVLGADVAKALGKGPGDTLVSSPQNLFDLDGVYPLEMQIVGVLAPTNSADDAAIFVDIKTAWVIQGIGHGHEDVVTQDEVDAGTAALANAAIVKYQRITPDNIESFHFHGAQNSYPATAVIVVPYDVRSGTILRGRYLAPEATTQLVEPTGIVQALVDRIFRIKSILDMVTMIIAIAAFAAIGLAIFLSYRLRAAEIATAVKLGARRSMVFRLLATETLVLLALSITLAVIGSVIIASNADAWVGWLLALGT